jgi:hypothetical protein
MRHILYDTVWHASEESLRRDILHEAPIFISARFRSGSTLLWHLFRQIPACRAYYEPCHDQLLAHIEVKTPPLEGHLGVQSYWDEYFPILDQLKELHDRDFGVNRLLLEANDTHEELAQYVQFLISSAAPGIAVLQFNRVDFRLPWLRAQFPEAKILHMFRNSRDQWFSMVKDLSKEQRLNSYINTGYELMTWSCSLAFDFPFLFSPRIRSSYHRHYILWKLSKLMGERCSDLSVDFDNDLIGNPRRTIEQILTTSGLTVLATDPLANLVSVPKSGQWRAVESEEWFHRAEAECDEILEQHGLLDRFGLQPLPAIKLGHPEEWQAFGDAPARGAIECALNLFSEARSKHLAASSSILWYDQRLHSYDERLKESLRENEAFRQRLADLS